MMGNPAPPLTGSQQGQGIATAEAAPGLLDFNDPNLGGSTLAFAKTLAGLMGQAPKAPSPDLPRMAGPQVDLSSVLKVLAARNARKMGLG
jgi:hypothetical protein